MLTESQPLEVPIIRQEQELLLKKEIVILEIILQEVSLDQVAQKLAVLEVELLVVEAQEISYK